MAVVMGVVFGYIVTALFNILEKKHYIFSWRCSFYFQFIILLLALIYFYYVDEEMLASNGILTEIMVSKDDSFESYPVMRNSLRSTGSIIFNSMLDYDID